jgi:hypothetical protein
MLIHSRTIRVDNLGAYATTFSISIEKMSPTDAATLQEALSNFYRGNELEDHMKGGYVLECAVDFDCETSSVVKIDYELVKPKGRRRGSRSRGFGRKSR